jgi:hypothetical protein
MEENRICKQCGVEKPITQFSKSQVHHGGHIPVCKECKNWNHRSPKSKEKEQTKWRLLAIGLKYCPNCNTLKNVNEFALNGVHNDGLRAYCKKCDNERGLKYTQREDIRKRKHEKESTREFLDNLATRRRNSEKYQSNAKKYRESSPVYSAYTQEYRKRKYVRIRRNISTRIWSELRLYNTTKESSFNEYLGCTTEFFMSYIQDRFTEGMSWDNWGRGSDKWHIDHIHPCADFNMFDDMEVRKCFHYTNQQPLWEPENLRKNNKYNGVICHKNLSK